MNQTGFSIFDLPKAESLFSEVVDLKPTRRVHPEAAPHLKAQSSFRSAGALHGRRFFGMRWQAERDTALETAPFVPKPTDICQILCLYKTVNETLTGVRSLPPLPARGERIKVRGKRWFLDSRNCLNPRFSNRKGEATARRCCDKASLGVSRLKTSLNGHKADGLAILEVEYIS